MKLRDRESKPCWGDGFYYKRRFDKEGKQPNGEIISVTYESEEVIVNFYSNLNGVKFSNDMETFYFDQLENRWSDRFNQWMPD